MITEAETLELLSDYLDDRLDRRTRAAVEEGLQHYGEARVALNELQVVGGRLMALPRRSAPPGLAEAIATAARRQFALSRSGREMIAVRQRLTLWRRMLPLAAAVALCCGGALTVWWLQHESYRRANSLTEHWRRGRRGEVAVVPGESSHRMLSRGTKTEGEPLGQTASSAADPTGGSSPENLSATAPWDSALTESLRMGPASRPAPQQASDGDRDRSASRDAAHRLADRQSHNKIELESSGASGDLTKDEAIQEKGAESSRKLREAESSDNDLDLAVAAALDGRARKALSGSQQAAPDAGQPAGPLKIESPESLALRHKGHAPGAPPSRGVNPGQADSSQPTGDQGRGDKTPVQKAAAADKLANAQMEKRSATPPPPPGGIANRRFIGPGLPAPDNTGQAKGDPDRGAVVNHRKGDQLAEGKALPPLVPAKPAAPLSQQPQTKTRNGPEASHQDGITPAAEVAKASPLLASGQFGGPPSLPSPPTGLTSQVLRPAPTVVLQTPDAAALEGYLRVALQPWSTAGVVSWSSPVAASQPGAPTLTVTTSDPQTLRAIFEIFATLCDGPQPAHAPAPDANQQAQGMPARPPGVCIRGLWRVAPVNTLERPAAARLFGQNRQAPQPDHPASNLRADPPQTLSAKARAFAEQIVSEAVAAGALAAATPDTAARNGQGKTFAANREPANEGGVASQANRDGQADRRENQSRIFQATPGEANNAANVSQHSSTISPLRLVITLSGPVANIGSPTPAKP